MSKENADKTPFPWELHDRIFSEEHMYGFVERKAAKFGLSETQRALPYMSESHKGQTRKGKEHIPYIYHPLLMACHAFALGLREDALIASILLHDVCEDCGIAPSALPFTPEIRNTVRLLTYEKKDGESDDDAHDRYYSEIKKDRLATIVKVIDRCNNVSAMMGSFTRERMISYINETEKYVMPLLDELKFGYDGKYNDIAFLIKYHLRSVMDNDKHALFEM